MRVTTSIGIAYCRKSELGQADLLKVADCALYAAKAAGKNTWSVATLDDAIQGSQ